jgi:hypothetical protein
VRFIEKLNTLPVVVVVFVFIVVVNGFSRQFVNSGNPPRFALLSVVDFPV